MGPVILLWGMLLFLPMQVGSFTMSWVGALAAILACIALVCVTLGLFARRRGLPFFIISLLFLFFSSAFALVEFDEYKLYQATVLKEQRIQEAIAEIRLRR